MTDLVYRGVRYRREDLLKEPEGPIPAMRYRGAEFDPRVAWQMSRPIYPGRFEKVYRAVSDRDDGPGGNAPALAFG